MIAGGITTVISWGDANGDWPATNRTVFNHQVNFVTIGDFNGDGENDFGVSRGNVPGKIWLNQGGGLFNVPPDIVLTGYNKFGCASGDLDGDGYDDFITGRFIFFGGPNGTSTTPNITLTTANEGFFCVFTDLDRDGHLDVLLANNVGGAAQIWLGGEDGPDPVADYALTTTQRSLRVAAGDLNGDGYNEVVYAVGGARIEFFEGTEDGWQTSSKRLIATTPTVNYGFDVHDVNKDGYDDVIVAEDTTVDIYLGGTTWPTSPDISMVADTWCYNIVVAEKYAPPVHMGAFTTRPIDLPQDMKWDLVNLEGVLPENTSLKISVLDRNGAEIPGYTDLTDWNVDLYNLDRNIHPSIQIKVTISSKMDAPTPVLDRLSVKWLDIRTWRDEFYGDVRTDRLSYLEVLGGMLRTGDLSQRGPDIIFPSILGNMGYTTTPRVFSDAGAMDYLSEAPMDLLARGTSAVDVADVNGDGYLDMAFAVYGTQGNTYDGKSPLFLGGPLGLRKTPHRTFDTMGATDVVLSDVDGDGHVDVVFSQVGTVNNETEPYSILFWGSEEGWADVPDVNISTGAASDVEVVDVDRDGRLDLVFACDESPANDKDSLVFLQDENGYCSTTPSHTLATNKAGAVASGDLDGDGQVDLVFANSRGGGFNEIDSFIYWGMFGGGFEEIPTGLPTMGAMDVLVTDLDDDLDLDIVFANHWNDTRYREVDSYVYLNNGLGGFGTEPDVRLPTVSANGVAVADIDGTGWMDLVFSCFRNDTSFKVPSAVYLGGASGWSSTPDIVLPTEGASDVAVAHLQNTGMGTYMSVPVRVGNARDTGTFHTLRYTSTLGPTQQGVIQLVDSVTLEVLFESRMSSGQHELDVSGKFLVREHPSVRVVALVTNIDSGGTFTLDDLWLNWTKRVRVPPVVVDIDLSEPFVYRLGTIYLSVNITDDYDAPGDLVVTVQHRLSGAVLWEDHLTPTLTFDETTGTWVAQISPRVDAVVGAYDLRVRARDVDDQHSEWIEFQAALEIRNNLPTTPTVHITPDKAVTTSSIIVVLDDRSMDVETTGLTYVYRWYRDGELFPLAITDNLPSDQTTKGENWTVEVTASDGEDESLPAVAWIVIDNAPPFPATSLPDLEMDEDTRDDQWFNLTGAFEDPDGDPIEWSLLAVPENMTVIIDATSGHVTIEPAPNWHGDQTLTFVASDGELMATQTVTVHVASVNDIPTIETVDGNPVTGDTIEYTIEQFSVLVIRYTLADIDGDEILVTITSLEVVHDRDAGTITYAPGEEDVGILTFTFSISDVVSVMDKVSLDFIINVTNKNDPMDDPIITNPSSGAVFKANATFTLAAICSDPDTEYGQVLNYTWESSISGFLGHGPSLLVAIAEPGNHEITVTVSDEEFSASSKLFITIEPEEVVVPPPPPTDDDGGNPNWALVAIVIAILVIFGVIIALLTIRNRAEEEAEEGPTAPQKTPDAVGGPADEWVAEGEEWEETFDDV
jgi:hypothetical protein